MVIKAVKYQNVANKIRETIQYNKNYTINYIYKLYIAYKTTSYKIHMTCSPCWKTIGYIRRFRSVIISLVCLDVLSVGN